MAATELELIATMLATGDLSPIHEGSFLASHCLTNEGKAIHHFLSMYAHITGGEGTVPTRNAVLERFSHLELPLAPRNPDVESLIHEVHVEATRTKLRDYATEIASVAESVDPLSELAAARAKLDEITAVFEQDEDYGLDTHADEILERYASGMLLPPGMPWPWPSLQAATNGMHEGELIVISGRPKTRKTFIALAVGVHAFENGARVVVFTPEMHPEVIMHRSLTIAARVRYAEFKRSRLNPQEERRLVDTVERFSHREGVPPGEGLFKVVKATNRDMSFVKAKALEYGADLVIVDSAYRLAPEGKRKSDSEWQSMTGISRSLKDVAAELEVPIIATHQLNRAGSKEPSLANLAYSDSFAQDADMVLSVVTQKRIDGPDRSGLFVLGAREADMEGVLINNVPCSDFTEIGPILSVAKAHKMLTTEPEPAAAHPTPTPVRRAARPVRRRSARPRLGELRRPR